MCNFYQLASVWRGWRIFSQKKVNFFVVLLPLLLVQKKCRFLNGLSFLTPFMFKTPFLLISSVLLQINYAHILLSMFSSCMFFNTGY